MFRRQIDWNYFEREFGSTAVGDKALDKEEIELVDVERKSPKLSEKFKELLSNGTRIYT